jgi:transcriptional regulator with XRE-family HTH domain
MSASIDLINVLKQELKAANMTYAELAQAIGMAESSVKRILAKGDTTLAKIDEICRALKLDFSDLARKLSEQQVLLAELTLAQEQGLVSDKKQLLVAICVLSQWTLEQITQNYLLSEAECIRCLAQLDRLGIIELRPMNRYQLKLAKTFKWRPHGPIMNFFRENALLPYFSGGFNGEGEGLLLVHGSISTALAPLFFERLQRVAQDFAQQHLADQKLAEKDREGFTLVLGMRSWEFEAFTLLRRPTTKRI